MRNLEALVAAYLCSASASNKSARSGRMSAPLSRQIGYIVDRPEYKAELRQSSLLSLVAQDPSTSSSEWHKLSLRINSLLHPNQDLAKGLSLAYEMTRQVPWDVVVSYASQWMTSALTHFLLAPQEAIILLNRLLDHDAKQKAEYWRKVASVNVSKYATVLLEAAEGADVKDSGVMASILEALCLQARLHPSVYRSHAAQIQKLCAGVLQEKSALTLQAGALLAALHVTGKGRDVQVQLWTTTLDLLIKDIKVAWAACSSAFAAAQQDERSQPGLLSELPSDDMEALYEAHSRLRLLLGSPPTAGIIAIFLSEPTTHAVPVPLDRLVTLLLSILSVTSSSAPRQQPPPEATLWAAQTSLLTIAHISALTLLASLPIQVYYSKTSRIVSRLLRIIEKSSPAVRCVALTVLKILDLPLNPESQVLIHCTRTCLAQVARLLKASDKPTSSDKKTIDKGNKRRKIYESDQVQFTQKQGFVNMDEDEYQGCIAAIENLPSLYEGLATHLGPEHHDLAHTTALVLLGISEISLQDADNLAAASLQALSQLVRLSRGSILALLTTRAASLASQGLVSQHHATKESARRLSEALEFTFHPRLAPKLSLRLHVEEDVFKAEEQETVLEKVELEEDRGVKEVEAMRDVLEIQTDAEQEGELSNGDAALIESPRRSTFAPLQHSPDPVKPTHRPSTPRIGSPLLTSGTASRSSVGNASNLIPPELPLSAAITNTQVFGATATTKTSASPSVSSPLGHTNDNDAAMDFEEDSDEEGIPELDLRSSDEED